MLSFNNRGREVGEIIAGIILLCIGVLVSTGLDRLGITGVVLGGLLIIVVILGIATIVSLVNKTSYDQLSNTHRKEIETLIADLQELLPETIVIEDYEWLHDQDKMLEVECYEENRVIWVISPDLSNDAAGGDTQSAIKNNIKNGVVYTYIVPDEAAINARVSILETNVFNSSPEKLNVHPITKDDFESLAGAHIAIYNPYDETPRVFLELPIKERGYWVKVDENLAMAYIGRFKKIAEKGTT